MSSPESILERIDAAPSLDEEALFNNVVSATFVEADDEALYFDLGEDRRARVQRDEVGDEIPYAAGEPVPLLVEEPRGETWMASLRKAEKLAVWRWLESIHQSQEPVEGMITAENKGGLSVDIGVRAFLPRSQVALHRVKDFRPFLGQRVPFHVIEFDKKQGNVVVSRRKILEAERAEERKDLVANLAKGQRHTGIVRNLTNFGAFVDIGGIDGLLHVTNISWERVNHPKEVLSVGDQVDVVVLDWNPDKKRLGLGRKQLLDNPWDEIQKRFKVDQVVTGKVTSLAEFGAFVELEPGLEGLVHITEFSWTRRINHPRQVLNKGEEVEVKIISIDPEKERIGLSIKRLEENPWEVVAENYPVGTRLTGPIKNITDFGLFVEVEAGVEGLVHISDLSWTKNIQDANEHYSAGDEVEVIVLDIDTDSQRMSLGIKQLEDAPWEEALANLVEGEKVDATITRLAPFGAFAELVEGVEGLIHISELSADRVGKPAEVVRPGQKVNVLVMSVDKKKRRIGLSLFRDELPVEEADISEYSDDTGDSATTLGDLLGAQLQGSTETGDED